MGIFDYFKNKRNSKDIETSPEPILTPKEHLFLRTLDRAVSQNRLATLDLTNRIAFGQENHWSADQETNTLDLQFEDGYKVRSKFEIIGSFNPKKRTFLFACDNASISTENSGLSSSIKKFCSDCGVPELTKRSFELVCLAFEFGDIVAIIRGIDEQHRSIFMGVKNFQYINPPGAECSQADFLQYDDDQNLSEKKCVDHLKGYFSEMNSIEESWYASGETDQLETFRIQQYEVYEKYWHRDNDFWKPSSIGGGYYNSREVDQWIVFSKRKGGRFVLPFIEKGYRNKPYAIANIMEAPKIVDLDVDWGQNCLWASRELSVYDMRYDMSVTWEEFISILDGFKEKSSHSHSKRRLSEMLQIVRAKGTVHIKRITEDIELSNEDALQNCISDHDLYLNTLDYG